MCASSFGPNAEPDTPAGSSAREGGGSDDGGIELLRELWPKRRSSSSIRASNLPTSATTASVPCTQTASISSRRTPKTFPARHEDPVMSTDPVNGYGSGVGDHLDEVRDRRDVELLHLPGELVGNDHEDVLRGSRLERVRISRYDPEIVAQARRTRCCSCQPAR